MLNASPLMHGEGKGLSSVTFVPARAAAKDIVGAETGRTKAADCTMAEVEATGVGAIRTGIDGREAGDVNSACQSNGMAENREATIKEKR
jgi:hypothetical protein